MMRERGPDVGWLAMQSNYLDEGIAKAKIKRIENANLGKDGPSLI